MFVVLGGSAFAAGLIRNGDIAPGAVTGKTIRNGTVGPNDLSARTKRLFRSSDGVAGAKGDTGATGTPGAGGTNGANGAHGIDGDTGAAGTNGANGANGPNGANGIDGIDGTNGTNGTDGLDGEDGVDGTIAPLSATQGVTPLPTASDPTTVVTLAVPAGNYVVLAKTQLTHSGAGDRIDCVLKAGATSLDQITMKTLPALAAISASLQAVATVSGPGVTNLTVECDVLTADGSASFNSLIAIPTG